MPKYVVIPMGDDARATAILNVLDAVQDLPRYCEHLIPLAPFYLRTDEPLTETLSVDTVRDSAGLDS